MRKYLLLSGLFILGTLNDFSQYQPFDDSGLQKIYVSTTVSDSVTGSVDSPYLTVKKALSKAMELKKQVKESISISVGRYSFPVGVGSYNHFEIYQYQVSYSSVQRTGHLPEQV